MLCTLLSYVIILACIFCLLAWSLLLVTNPLLHPSCYAWCIKSRGSVDPRLVCFAFKCKFKIMHTSRGSSAYILSTLLLIILVYMQILYYHQFTKKGDIESTFIVLIYFGIDDIC
jgi:phosphoglycerol transferase MdoB-like AlkP superfamily enzyme